MIPDFIKSESSLKKFLRWWLNFATKIIPRPSYEEIKHKRIKVLFNAFNLPINGNAVDDLKKRYKDMRDLLVSILDNDYHYRQTYHAILDYLKENDVNDGDNEGWYR